MRHDITALRASLARHRAQRRERHLLERELASFDTASSRSELEAILERHSTHETATIQPVLDRVLARRPLNAH